MAIDRRQFGMDAMALSRAFGYLFEYEVAAIQTLAASLPAGAKMVNFGAGTGTSGLALVAGNPQAQVWTIDISEGGPLGGLQNERNAFANTNLRLPMQVLGCSWEVGLGWRGELDLVFVDGDHSWQAVGKDIRAWLPHVRKGGYMLFHDYQRDVWPDVQSVVDEHMAKFTEMFTIETLKVFRI